MALLIILKLLGNKLAIYIARINTFVIEVSAHTL
jgi:hypothetical protein